jgi:type IV pilus assembly protein PilB
MEADGERKARAVHWLVRIVERARRDGAATMELRPGTPILDAWAAVTRAYRMSEAELADLVAKYYRLQVADFHQADLEVAGLVSEAMARKHHIVPVREEERHLVVATCDPTDVETERAVGFSTGKGVVFEVASPSAIREALDARFAPGRTMESILGTLDINVEDLDAVSTVEDGGPESVSEDDAGATPVIRLTNLIITEAVTQGASDIHIEPGRSTGSVRYRVDGVLRKHMDLPMPAMNRVVSRIKILARLDIADRIRPQDGKVRVKVRDNFYDLRVSTIPAAGSEKCVIRILDSNTSVTLEDLDIPPVELERMRELLTHRSGVVVVTGPTGSGKTTTLYGALRELADGKVNIMTVEDPVEYDLPAITQTQVETKQGVTFGSALRAILRQDPDVILVGEIRDRETAEVAAQAAMTGHLVLATVHANDAVSAVGRLADIGLPYPLIAQTLRGALAQRLLRKVCSACAEPVRGALTPDEERLRDRHEVEPVVRAVGCVECGFTGYRGRLPVVEVLHAGPRFQDAIEQHKGWGTLTRVAVEGGMRPMHVVGVEWVEQGRTTLVELERILGQQLEDEPEKAHEGPPRVLVMDDDADARLLLRTVLTKEGYEVIDAKSGPDGLELLREDPDVQLVILDLAMPGMSGHEVLKEIRSQVDTMAIPVLVRTGTGSDEAEAELLDAGADEYVPKSTDATRFLARVRAVLRRSV